ncbi:hypothetical protein [Chromobacterium haemolyticum]|uniref:hypothetical protein n=1 Tax=Chromobacterium haemolyticum TaxID=394935 RepID=UPI0011B26509|nr:hypothetical protein [Chromobacterium haemolyticum]
MKIKFIMLPLVFSAAAMAKPVYINIDSDVQNKSITYNAKIRLASGSEWVNLGPVHSGMNKFNIHADVDGEDGTLWLEGLGSQKFVSHFSKEKGDDVIEFKFNSLKSEKQDENAVIEYNSTGSGSGLNYKKLGVNRRAEVYALSPDATNSWPTVCEFAAAGVTGQKVLICAIKSTPQIVFTSTSDSGLAFRVGVFKGNFSSKYSASYIKGKPTKYGFQGWLFYSKIKFDGGPNLHFGEFSGGGIGVGLYTGNGMFM